jgi:uncharacterized membrane protein YphA (DoxX/SURF4 family)
MKKETLVEIICFLYIILFIYAATMKLMDIEKFRIQIGQSPLLVSQAHVVAWVVPLTEILLAILLAIPRVRLIGLYASFSLMVMFTTYIVVITNFSEHIPCSCGGVLEKLNWNQHLVFNIVFDILAIVAIGLLDTIKAVSPINSRIQVSTSAK